MAMRIWLIAALVAGCGAGAPRGGSALQDGLGPPQGQPADAIEVAGMTSHFDFEGGFWAIVTMDGVVYDPVAPLDAQWQRQGLPVRALVRPRYDLILAHAAGTMVEVLRVEQMSCAEVPCPPPAPAVALVLMTPTGGVAREATLANVRGPSSASPSFECVTASDTPTSPVLRKCIVAGAGPGLYEADVTAAGFAPLHLSIEVPARVASPDECCPATYVLQVRSVFLTPVR